MTIGNLHKSSACSCVIINAKAGLSTGSRTAEGLEWESQVGDVVSLCKHMYELR